MKNTYDVIIQATIEYRGEIEADTVEDAISEVTNNRLRHGEIMNPETVRAVYLDPEIGSDVFSRPTTGDLDRISEESRQTVSPWD